jgi:hypothetical protein
MSIDNDYENMNWDAHVCADQRGFVTREQYLSDIPYTWSNPRDKDTGEERGDISQSQHNPDTANKQIFDRFREKDTDIKDVFVAVTYDPDSGVNIEQQVTNRLESHKTLSRRLQFYEELYLHCNEQHDKKKYVHLMENFNIVFLPHHKSSPIMNNYHMFYKHIDTDSKQRIFAWFDEMIKRTEEGGEAEKKYFDEGRKYFEDDDDYSDDDENYYDYPDPMYKNTEENKKKYSELLPSKEECNIHLIRELCLGKHCYSKKFIKTLRQHNGGYGYDVNWFENFKFDEDFFKKHLSNDKEHLNFHNIQILSTFTEDSYNIWRHTNKPHYDRYLREPSSPDLLSFAISNLKFSDSNILDIMKMEIFTNDALLDETVYHSDSYDPIDCFERDDKHLLTKFAMLCKHRPQMIKNPNNVEEDFISNLHTKYLYQQNGNPHQNLKKLMETTSYDFPAMNLYNGYHYVMMMFEHGTWDIESDGFLDFLRVWHRGFDLYNRSDNYNYLSEMVICTLLRSGKSISPSQILHVLTFDSPSNEAIIAKVEECEAKAIRTGKKYDRLTTSVIKMLPYSYWGRLNIHEYPKCSILQYYVDKRDSSSIAELIYNPTLEEKPYDANDMYASHSLAELFKLNGHYHEYNVQMEYCKIFKIDRLTREEVKSIKRMSDSILDICESEDCDDAERAEWVAILHSLASYGNKMLPHEYSFRERPDIAEYIKNQRARFSAIGLDLNSIRGSPEWHEFNESDSRMYWSLLNYDMIGYDRYGQATIRGEIKLQCNQEFFAKLFKSTNFIGLSTKAKTVILNDLLSDKCDVTVDPETVCELMKFDFEVPDNVKGKFDWDSEKNTTIVKTLLDKYSDVLKTETGKNYLTELLQCNVIVDADEIKKISSMGIDINKVQQMRNLRRHDDSEYKITELIENNKKLVKYAEEKDSLNLSIMKRMEDSEDRSLKLLEMNKSLVQFNKAVLQQMNILSEIGKAVVGDKFQMPQLELPAELMALDDDGRDTRSLISDYTAVGIEQSVRDDRTVTTDYTVVEPTESKEEEDSKKSEAPVSHTSLDTDKILDEYSEVGGDKSKSSRDTDQMLDEYSDC